MKIVQGFATISYGAIAGWLAVASFMVLHDGASIGEVLWLVTLWLPVAAVYSAIIVAVSYRVLARFAPRCCFCSAALSVCFHSSDFGRHI
jgi:hypothetical protein